MLKEISVKFSYNLDNETKTGNMKLNVNDNLENAFNKSTNIKSIKNKEKEIEFYLQRENEKKILLNKCVKIKELYLKEGDLILVDFKDKINPLEKTSGHYNPYHSTDNLNDGITSSSNTEKPLKKGNNLFLIMMISIAIVIIGVIIFLIIYLIKNKNSNKKIINETIDNKQNNNPNNDDNNNDNNSDNMDDNNNDIDNNSDNNNDNNSDNNSDNNNSDYNIEDEEGNDTQYYLEELITQTRPYYPNNSIFLYKSNKIMNMELESILKNNTDEYNATNIKECMDFGLIIREGGQEIFEEESLIRNWFTGYITLLNLNVNNGTHDMGLSYNKELKKIINGVNDINKRNLNDANDSSLLNDENELCFVKINFYENGIIKDIFYPKDFNINMVYINVITKLIIPKLSKNLYSESINEKIESLNKYLEGPNNDEEIDIIPDSSIVNEQDINSDKLFTENILSDLKSDYLDENEIKSDLLYEDNLNKSNEDSPKYNFKGIEENLNFSNITDFEMESLEGPQAKLEGSLLRRIKNFLIDKKGMLTNILESENITITQPRKESLTTLTKEEEKLKSEIYNDNNEIPRMDLEDFPGKNISFDISNIKCMNFNNVSLYDSIINEELAKNIFNYFDSFTYTKYDILGNDDLKFRALKDLKEDFLKQNPDFDPSEIQIEHSKLSSKKNKTKRYLQNGGSYYGMKNYQFERILFKYDLIGLIMEGFAINEINVATGVTVNYIKLIFGSLELNIPFNKMKTNLHIIIRNSHQMTYNMMGLLYNSTRI